MSLTNVMTRIALLILLLISQHAVSTEPRAINKFSYALAACDRGMKMKMPKSKGSLRVLTSLFKRYQSNRDDALKLDESVKELETEYYTGDFFSEQINFADAYHVCENDFAGKVAKAEALIEQQSKLRKDKQKELEAKQQLLLENKQAAKREMFLAINEYCARYLREPNKPFLPLYNDYQLAKQKSLKLYADIVTQTHQATIIDTDTGQEVSLTKTVQQWFEYCEAAFNRHSEQEATTTPSVVSMSPSTEIPPKPETALATVADTTPIATIPTPPISPIQTPNDSIPPSTEQTAPISEAKLEEVLPKAKSEEIIPKAKPEEAIPKAKSEEAIPKEEVIPKVEKEIPEPIKPVTKPVESPISTPPTVTSKEETPTDTTSEEDTTPSTPTIIASREPTVEHSPEAPAMEDAGNDESYDAAAADQEEYKQVMATLAGDRLKVLKDEKRLPDFVDDEDNQYKKAKIWQYENDDGSKCKIYTFKGDKLSQSKTQKGECPPFW